MEAPGSPKKYAIPEGYKELIRTGEYGSYRPSDAADIRDKKVKPLGKRIFQLSSDVLLLSEHEWLNPNSDVIKFGDEGKNCSELWDENWDWSDSWDNVTGTGPIYESLGWDPLGGYQVDEYPGIGPAFEIGGVFQLLTEHTLTEEEKANIVIGFVLGFTTDFTISPQVGAMLVEKNKRKENTSTIAGRVRDLINHFDPNAEPKVQELVDERQQTMDLADKAAAEILSAQRISQEDPLDEFYVKGELQKYLRKSDILSSKPLVDFLYDDIYYLHLLSKEKNADFSTNIGKYINGDLGNFYQQKLLGRFDSDLKSALLNQTDYILFIERTQEKFINDLNEPKVQLQILLELCDDSKAMHKDDISSNLNEDNSYITRNLGLMSDESGQECPADGTLVRETPFGWEITFTGRMVVWEYKCGRIRQFLHALCIKETQIDILQIDIGGTSKKDLENWLSQYYNEEKPEVTFERFLEINEYEI